MDEQNRDKKKLALKIILPILIAAAIAGIWFVKTNEDNSPKAAVKTETVQTDASKLSAETGSESTAGTVAETTTDPTADPTAESTAETTAETTAAEVNPDFVLSVTEIDLEQLKSYGLPIIIDFGSDSCFPCKEMAPVLGKMHEEWLGKVIVKYVDIWKNPDAADDFPVQVIPTQFIFDAEGKPYVPSDSSEIQFQMYSLQDSDEHMYTAHQGGLTEDDFRAIFAEMGIE